MKNILIINGSLTGKKGNTNFLLEEVYKILKVQNINITTIHLESLTNDYIPTLEESLNKADGVIFSTGTYWDSWGSPMQKFLEEACIFEATPTVLFKPCAVIVSMHFVGGKEVLSRLQGVLNTMGFLIPPMSGFVYSLTSHIALQTENNFGEDFWSIQDLEIVIHNLLTSMNNDTNFKSWTVDIKDPKRRWLI